MPIANGARLGPYEILAPLGAGGMGEVYRARDPRLGRDVAIKVVSAAVTADANRVRRFEQEARAAAALNHPNILTVHEINVDNGVPYIVSELLEGQTLRDALAAGALPLRTTIGFGIQIANGLAAAHEKGIVHRDLKPENIFVTSDGRVKLLDFGLAKLLETTPATTVTPAVTMTVPGVVMGTVGYMSPEQVRGEPADERSDIFSFGAVLYEMVTRRRAFERETPFHALTAVLDDDVPSPTVNGSPITPRLVRVIRRCLEKKPQARFQSARDLAFVLSDEFSDALPNPTIAGSFRRGNVLAMIGLVIVSSVAAAWVGARVVGHSDQSDDPSLRLTVDATQPAPYTPDDSGGLAVSPDGTSLVFTGRRNEARSLFIRRLDDFLAHEIVGTKNAVGPFFSPDGKWVAFEAANALMKVPVTGGTAVSICRLPAPLRGGTWADNGIIFFGLATSGGILQVADVGGEPRPATALEGTESFHRWPSALPGGRGFLYTDWGLLGRVDLGTIFVKPPAGEARLIIRAGSAARYVKSGHIVFVGAEGLMAVAFDLQSSQPRGPAFALGDRAITTPNGGAAWGVGDNGTFVYARPRSLDATTSVVWLDRTGHETSTRAARAAYEAVTLSPDGSKAAVQIGGIESKQHIWTYDFQTETANRLTFDETSNHTNPQWSPDGTRIAYRKGRPTVSGSHVFTVGADGLTPELQVTTMEPAHYMPSSWSRDGRILMLESVDGRFDTLLVLDKPSPTTQLLPPGAPRQMPRLSPDGRWLAYASAESGKPEIIVQPFPSMTGRWQVSVDGGVAPLWRRDGRALFYMNDGRLMETAIDTASGFSAGQPKELFAGPYRTSYDVTPDGQRFLMIRTPPSASSPSQFNVITNWFAELQGRHEISVIR